MSLCISAEMLHGCGRLCPQPNPKGPTTAAVVGPPVAASATAGVWLFAPPNLSTNPSQHHTTARLTTSLSLSSLSHLSHISLAYRCRISLLHLSLSHLSLSHLSLSHLSLLHLSLSHLSIVSFSVVSLCVCHLCLSSLSHGMSHGAGFGSGWCSSTRRLLVVGATPTTRPPQ